jgi:hypothetical protein
VLTEAYSYAPFKDRVLVTRDFCRALLEFADAHRDEIRTLLDDARRSTVEAGRNPSDRVAIRTKARALPEKATVLGFVERVENGRNVATREPKDYTCALEIDFAPALEVPRPFAYLIPAGSATATAVDVLRAHGIAVEALKDEAKLALEVETIQSFVRGRRPFEGHETVDVLTSKITRQERPVPAGTLVVRTAQPLGSLAVYLLEPRSDDGLVTWNFFDNALVPAGGADFPVTRLRQPAEIATKSLP